MNLFTWEETNGYEAIRIYRANAVSAVPTVIRLQGRECMAGLKGKSSPPGNMNAFKHSPPEGKPKIQYLIPLDEITERIKVSAKPYLHTRATGETNDTLRVNPEEGRAARTVALR